MIACIDLKATFGRRYRIGTDPAATPRNQDPWLWIIHCRNGEIHPQGGNRLAAWTNRRGQIAGQLMRLPCVEVVQDGDDGATVAFDVADFKQVAAVMKPKRRRVLTEEQRQRLVDMGKAHRLTGAKGDLFERQRDPMGGVVSLDVPAIGSVSSVEGGR